MKQEQQNIAIAEACGWTRHVVDNADADGPIMNGGTMVRWTAPGEALNRNPYWSKTRCPDYLHDLNAMHEAEKVLTNQQRKIYGEKLLKLLSYWNSEIKNHGHAVYELSHATAAQRAEAFLSTIGKWEENTP